MRLPEAKIEMATSQEYSRYTMQAVKLDVEKKVMVATDGHILACIPASVEPQDHTALIGLDTMKQLRAIDKQNKKQNKSAHTAITTNGKVTVESLNSKSEFPVVEGNFPNWEAVKPDMTGPATISLNAALLLRLAQAISDNSNSKTAVVKLWIKDANSAIGVQVSDSSAWGAIMPCRLDPPNKR